MPTVLNQSNTLYSRFLPMSIPPLSISEKCNSNYLQYIDLKGQCSSVKPNLSLKPLLSHRHFSQITQVMTLDPELLFFFHRIPLGLMWRTFQIGREEGRGGKGEECREGKEKGRNSLADFCIDLFFHTLEF